MRPLGAFLIGEAIGDGTKKDFLDNFVHCHADASVTGVLPLCATGVDL